MILRQCWYSGYLEPISCSLTLENLYIQLQGTCQPPVFLSPLLLPILFLTNLFFPIFIQSSFTGWPFLSIFCLSLLKQKRIRKVKGSSLFPVTMGLRDGKQIPNNTFLFYRQVFLLSKKYNLKPIAAGFWKSQISEVKMSSKNSWRRSSIAWYDSRFDYCMLGGWLPSSFPFFLYYFHKYLFMS